MDKRNLMIYGATGLVGGHVLDLASRDNRFDRILVLARRAPSPAPPPNVEVRIVDFARPETLGSLAGIDAAICALGTTIRTAGSRENFRKVDFTYALDTARLARAAGVGRFLVVTSMGTSPRSPLFYSRVKGELEEALKDLGFPYLGIVRPSFLAGQRAEHRPGEGFAMKFGFLMPKKYKPIAARTVAAVMIRRAAADDTGLEIIESDRLQDFAAERAGA